MVPGLFQGTLAPLVGGIHLSPIQMYPCIQGQGLLLPLLPGAAFAVTGLGRGARASGCFQQIKLNCDWRLSILACTGCRQGHCVGWLLWRNLLMAEELVTMARLLIRGKENPEEVICLPQKPSHPSPCQPCCNHTSLRWRVGHLGYHLI